MSIFFVEVSKGFRPADEVTDELIEFLASGSGPVPDTFPRSVVEGEISRIKVLADTDAEALLIASQIAGCTCSMALASRITEAIL